MGSMLLAQQPQAPEGPIFGNDGETVVYYVSRDAKGRQGTVSDALQNVPGVKVDTEGNISLRGVSEVEVFINGQGVGSHKGAYNTFVFEITPYVTPGDSCSVAVVCNNSQRLDRNPDRYV